MHAPTGPTHTPATSRAASVSYIKLGGGLFRLRSASSAGVVLRGLLAAEPALGDEVAMDRVMDPVVAGWLCAADSARPLVSRP